MACPTDPCLRSRHLGSGTPLRRMSRSSVHDASCRSSRNPCDTIRSIRTGVCQCFEEGCLRPRPTGDMPYTWARARPLNTIPLGMHALCWLLQRVRVGAVEKGSLSRLVRRCSLVPLVPRVCTSLVNLTEHGQRPEAFTAATCLAPESSPPGPLCMKEHPMSGPTLSLVMGRETGHVRRLIPCIRAGEGPCTPPGAVYCTRFPHCQEESQRFLVAVYAPHCSSSIHLTACGYSHGQKGSSGSGVKPGHRSLVGRLGWGPVGAGQGEASQDPLGASDQRSSAACSSSRVALGCPSCLRTQLALKATCSRHHAFSTRGSGPTGTDTDSHYEPRLQGTESHARFGP